MPEFCDVALPVPLDMVFTYRVPADATPVVGGRVLVPFRQQRLTGIVVELHDRKPSVTIKPLLNVLDIAPVLDEQLLRLGRWIADYYLAPLGEVFRTMLPLNAEFKRAIAYRITAQGRMALHLAGMSGSSARSRRTPEEQAAEFQRARLPCCGRAGDRRERTSPRRKPALGDSRLEIDLERDGAQEVAYAGGCIRRPRCDAHRQSCAP